MHLTVKIKTVTNPVQTNCRFTGNHAALTFLMSGNIPVSSVISIKFYSSIEDSVWSCGLSLSFQLKLAVVVETLQPSSKFFSIVNLH